ncbi:hypothetical protein [Aquicella lusitana]|nr:hypothetical protein [Aquicella lusitana]
MQKGERNLIKNALRDGRFAASSGMLGCDQVVAGVYDILNNKYWISDHMGWPDEIFK